MIEINLLPKEYLKKSRGLALGKAGKIGIAGACVVLLAVSAITFFQMNKLNRLDANIAKAQQRAANLRKDIALVDALSDVKLKITQRMSAIDELDRHRSSYVRILEDIARNIPEFVWLAKYQEVNKDQSKEKKAVRNKTDKKETSKKPAKLQVIQAMKIEGYTFTLNALAAFMIKMMRSDYFDEVELKSIVENQQDEQKAYNFIIACNVHRLTNEELKSLAGGAKKRQLASTSRRSRKGLN